jgi:hypothetical protein
VHYVSRLVGAPPTTKRSECYDPKPVDFLFFAWDPDESPFTTSVHPGPMQNNNGAALGRRSVGGDPGRKELLNRSSSLHQARFGRGRWKLAGCSAAPCTARNGSSSGGGGEELVAVGMAAQDPWAIIAGGLAVVRCTLEQ